MFMEDGRDQWIKPSGSGSQDTETDAQEMKAKLILGASTNIKKYFNDLNEEYED